MPNISGMVRPIDLRREGEGFTGLRCDECVAEYLVTPDDYVWMFEGDSIDGRLKTRLRRQDSHGWLTCEGCGSELVPLEKASGEA